MLTPTGSMRLAAEGGFMEQSDLDGIARDGARARKRGVSFHANPHYDTAMPWSTEAHMLEWHSVTSAWASGWLREDAGRDEHVAALMRHRLW